MAGLPPIEEQNRFEEIYKQADKSKFELRKSIDMSFNNYIRLGI